MNPPTLQLAVAPVETVSDPTSERTDVYVGHIIPSSAYSTLATYSRRVLMVTYLEGDMYPTR
jgi:hypothetical protein